MFSEWTSISPLCNNEVLNFSVLNQFPPSVSKDVAASVVKYVAQNSNSGKKSEADVLDTVNLSEGNISWIMEVIAYGLSLPLTEIDTVKDCVSVYCDWLTSLNKPKSEVPAIIVNSPDIYCIRIIGHLLNLFVPRYESELIQRQAVHCHRVLRTLQDICKESPLSRDVWNAILKFLLLANNNLLSPPIVKNDKSGHLCARTITVLFETWLLACQKCFPSPPLWKTFRDLSVYWRHHESLIVQWHRFNHLLVSFLIKNLYGPSYPQLHISEDEVIVAAVTEMPEDCLSQTWFRFLHIMQNPVDLCHVEIFMQFPKFLMSHGTDSAVIPAQQHECLDDLPLIFFKAMRGVSIIVNAFLGVEQSVSEDNLMSHLGAVTAPCKTPSSDHTTPPSLRKSGRPFSVPASQKASRPVSVSAISTTVSSRPSSAQPSINYNAHFSNISPSVAHNRPSCNSILHVFGSWLFEAALAHVQLHSSHSIPTDRRSSLLIDNSSIIDSPIPNNIFESGRAEACATLCRIFSTHKTGEDIHAIYLSRFYIIMYYGLQTDESSLSGKVLSSILFNSCDLLRVDLSGIQILVPYFVNAIELVLTSDTKTKFNEVLMSSLPVTTMTHGPHEQIPNTDLRKSCLHLLLSMVCLPQHLCHVQIRNIINTETSSPYITFTALKGHIVEIVHKALLKECDPGNTQMLLGGLLLLIYDIALYEELQENTVQSSLDSQESADLFSGDEQNSHENSSAKVMDSGNADILSKVLSSSKVMDTAYGLFGHATSLVCNRLMASWKTDLNNALAAIDVLSGLAKVRLHKTNTLMCKRTVKWICDFIVFQCSRPSPSHSRDLHSMIVAAYKCLTVWLVDHCNLLYDKESLYCILEVVELGISGSKSQNRASDEPKYKSDKQPMPASMRVKEAAEGVLSCIINYSGSFPPLCGPACLYSLLDEKSLLQYARGMDESRAHFKYFAVDNSIIIGLLEQPLSNTQDPLPLITALIRGPFGRHAWTMELRHRPRLDQNADHCSSSNPGRPMPMDNVGTHYNIKHSYFPSIVDKIAPTKVDYSIPNLEALSSDRDKQQLDMLTGFIESQMVFENQVAARHIVEANKTLYPNPETECKPSQICHEFQTARLFLQHYGCLSLESLKESSSSSLPPQLVMLDTSNLALFHDLDILDTISTRDANTVHVFYLKSGQTSPEEICRNVTSKSQVQPQFLEFIHSLGWPVFIKKHAGWTGSMSTSYHHLDVENIPDEQFTSGTGGGVFDGRDWILYWADIATEMAIIVPSIQSYMLAINSPSRTSGKPSVGSPTQDKDATTVVGIPKPLYLPLDKASSPNLQENTSASSGHSESTKRTQLRRQPEQMTGPDCYIFVVWLEVQGEQRNFPLADLLSACNTGHGQRSENPQARDVCIIFIHPLQNGLFRISIQDEFGRVALAIPLVDGMLVSRRTLGIMVRQTAINIQQRKRLNTELYYPTHVRRKFKIQDIIYKYQINLSEAEFYTGLFEDSAKKY